MRRATASAQHRFRRVRADHSRETAEDYTELVLDLGAGGAAVRPAALSRALGVSHVTVLKTLHRLEVQDMIGRDAGGGIRLTLRGRRLALAARRRHGIVVSFLRQLGVPSAIAEIDAEGIEHHVSATTLRRMRAFTQPDAPRMERR